MAFDGITIAAIVKELKEELTGGRIYKIAQPENDELLLTIKNNGGQKRLVISADPSLPLIYLTEENKQSPMVAPNFCMLLRKHLQNARILAFSQPELERVIQIELEHLNELGDLCKKKISIELMGKHSNIIFLGDENKIIDSIKHVSGMVSSVREVLPGRDYFIPKTQEKSDPLSVTKEEFSSIIKEKAQPVFKAVYGNFTGLSPLIAQEICHEAKVDADQPVQSLEEQELKRLEESFFTLIEKVKEEQFQPCIIYDGKTPIEYAAFPLSIYKEDQAVFYDSISSLLANYYREKNIVTRIRQRSVDLRKIVQTALERNVKKYDLQLKQMEDTRKKDKYRIYGELLNTYGYGAKTGDKSLEALNYYTNETIRIPLDPQLSASENAKKYFDKYNKLKRTYEALAELTVSVKEEIDHLESVSTALEIAQKEEDLVQIKEELIQSGYIRRKSCDKRAKITSKPFHYISSDGFHMYVGKNNLQNDELTFKLSTGNDWWFHAKGIPGSHVVVRTEGETLPDRTFEEAARLAAHYSKGGKQDKVEVDYTEKKNVKKPAGSKPGFVVYYTNYSMMIPSDISGIEEV